MGKTFIFDSEGLTITDSEEKLKSCFGEDLGKNIMKLAIQFAKIEELEKRVNLLETELEDIKKKIKKD